MRIALVTSYFPPHPGGQEFHVLELAQGLVEMGHDVTVVTSNVDRDDGPEPSDYRVVWLPSTRIASDAFTFGVGKALREAKPDVVHIHAPLCIIATQASMWARNTPLVATYHGDYYKSSLFANALRLLRNHLQLPYVLRNAGTINALSENDRRLMTDYGVDPDKIKIIYPGVDLAKFQVDQEAWRPNGKRILYVGRVVYEKGVKELITSFGALCQQEEDVELVIAGDGDALEDMRALARRSGLEDRVTFLGWLPHDEIIEQYGQAMVVVLPSFSEGMPYAVLEAMAAGRPVIASNVSGIKDVVDHQESGLLYDVSDPDGLREAMLRLVTDPEMCNRLGKRARERCHASFGRQRWLEDTVRVYESVL